MSENSTYLSRDNIQDILDFELDNEQNEQGDEASQEMTLAAQLVYAQQMILELDEKIKREHSEKVHRYGLFWTLSAFVSLCCALISPLVYGHLEWNLIAAWIIFTIGLAIMGEARRLAYA